MKNKTLLTVYVLFFLLIGHPFVFSQQTETYVVNTESVLFVRKGPSRNAQQTGISYPGGKYVEVFPELYKWESIEGVGGFWRRVKIEGRPGSYYMFGGHLLKKPTPSPLTKIDELNDNIKKQSSEIEKIKETLSKPDDQTPWVLSKIRSFERRYFDIENTFQLVTYALTGLALMTIMLFFLLLHKHNKALKNIAPPQPLEIPDIKKAIKKEINKAVPNVEEIIGQQIGALKKTIESEYEKKSYLKKIVIESESGESTAQTSPSLVGTINLQLDRDLFSNYFLKGYTRKYAVLPQSNTFFGRTLSNVKTDNSVYELRLPNDDDNTALFRLLDDDKIIGMALMHPAQYIYSACEIIGDGKIQQASELAYAYGIAKRDGENWKITQKSKLKFQTGADYIDELYKEESRLEEEKSEAEALINHVQLLKESNDKLHGENESLLAEIAIFQDKFATLEEMIKSLQNSVDDRAEISDISSSSESSDITANDREQQ